jgi:hypothetical protein
VFSTKGALFNRSLRQPRKLSGLKARFIAAISVTQPNAIKMCCRAGASPANGTVASPFAKGEGEGEGCFNPVETRC